MNYALNDVGAQNHHHLSYNEYINWGGSSHDKDMVKRVVYSSNGLVEMTSLMIGDRNLW